MPTRIAVAVAVVCFVWSPSLLAQEEGADAAARAVFDELEPVLAQAPARQVEWARTWASGRNPRPRAADVRAAVARAFPDDSAEMQAQTSLIALLILQGDVLGALRSFAVRFAATDRAFNRTIVQALDRVRDARSTVIRNFARTKPPRAYAGQNPSQAARAQDRAARYTQFVQMSTQLMNELQNTERELVDALQTMHRDLETFWQSYASLRDESARTNQRIIEWR